MSCRLCKRKFNISTKERTINIFKRKLNEVSISERLADLGVQVVRQTGFSDEICRPCETKVKTLEKSLEIKKEWGASNETNQRVIDGEQVHFIVIILLFQKFQKKFIELL